MVLGRPLLGVDVVEAERDVIVHVELPLGLPDQTQIGVIHHHVDIRQVELRAHCQFFDEELKVVVTGQTNHGRGRVGDDDAERCGQRPAERTCLPAVDPVAVLIDVQELSSAIWDSPIAETYRVFRSNTRFISWYTR